MTRSRLRIALLAPLLVSAVLTLAAPALAHRVDPLSAVPTAPAAGAAVEVLIGQVKEVLVDDRVAGIQVRYRSIVLADGTALSLRGTSLESVPKDSEVEIAGRRNGKILFVDGARVLRSVPPTRGAAKTTVDGDLQLAHIDYLEADKSEFQFDVRGADGNVTPLRLATLPEALQRGMKVVASGTQDADGVIDPDVISITALPREPADAKVAEKATRTDKVLVILMTFTDSAAPSFSQGDVQNVFAGGPGTSSVAEYYKEVSYGQQLLAATITPWLATGSATPANCDWRTMGTIGRNTATARGYVLSNYQKIVYVFPRVSACGWSGLAYVGASGAWINGTNSLLVYGHELGHNFGLLHAASLDCGTAPIGGTCSASEYGEPFGIMGNRTAMHVSVPQKLDLGWIASTAVKTHSAGTASYTINPLETAGGSVYAVKIPAATNRIYWLEYRQPIGFDNRLSTYPNNGAQIRVTAPFETLCGGCSASNIDTEFVDMTPATSAFTDGALLAGQSYTDTKYGVTINVISATASGLTVQVVGPGSSSTATTTGLASGANPSTFGASVTFTASVSGNAPTGTVAFRDGGTTLSGCAAVALAGSGNVRTATCTTSVLAAGTHSIVASYSGNAGNNASTSATLAQVVNAPTGGTNVALASAGATASASSVYSATFPVSSIINGERKGTTRWKDATPRVWPDWAQINFSGTKTIDRVVVYSVQDNYTNPVEPSSTMTFSLYGVADFTVQGWNGASWVTLATVSGNNLVKRTVTFTPYSTSRIRIHVTRGLTDHSRLTEVEAWGN